MKKKIKKSLAIVAIAIVMGAGAFTNGFHVQEAKAQASFEPIIPKHWLMIDREEGVWINCDYPGNDCLDEVVIKG